MNEVLMTLGPFTLTATGAFVTNPHELPDYEDWQSTFEWCYAAREASPFWVGDLAEFGEARYGEKYAQAMASTGYALQTVKNAAYVARAIAPERRRDDVSFSHHAEVAPLPPEEQTAWLQKVVDDDLTRDELRQQIKAEKVGPAKVQLWVIVSAVDAADQTALYNRMVMEGRSAKLKMTTAKGDDDDESPDAAPEAGTE